MPDLLAAVASLFRGSRPPTAAALAAALEDVGRAITGTERAIHDAEAAHATAIFDADDWAKTRDTLAIMNDELSRLHLAEGSLRERHRQAVAAEAAAARAAERETAIARRDAARKVMQAYQKAAAEIVRIIETVAEADAEVDAFNLALAPGEEPIGRTEDVRDNPGNRREILKSERVTLWCAHGTRHPVSEEVAAEISPLPDGGGVIHRRDHAGHIQRYFFERVTFNRQTIRLSRPYSMADRLANAILPGFEAGSPPIFRAPSEASPREILAIIRDRRAWRPEEDDGIAVEYVPLPDRLADAAE